MGHYGALWGIMGQNGGKRVPDCLCTVGYVAQAISVWQGSHHPHHVWGSTVWVSLATGYVRAGCRTRSPGVDDLEAPLSRPSPFPAFGLDLRAHPHGALKPKPKAKG